MPKNTIFAMGKFKEQQETKKEVKERYQSRRENLGKFFFDLAKLTFAAIVLTEIIVLKTDILSSNDWAILLFGCLFTLIFALIGNKILK